MSRKKINETNKDSPIGIDENTGENLYKCHYTGKILKESEVIWVGAVIPQANWKYAICKIEGPALHKHNRRLFEDNERNCNTCKNLERIPYPNRWVSKRKV